MTYDRRSFVAMLALMTFGLKARAAGDSKPASPTPSSSRMINDYNENPLGSGLVDSSYMNCDLALNDLKLLISNLENIDESRIFLGGGARAIIFEICSRAKQSGYNHFIMPVPDYGTAARFAAENGLKVTRVPNSFEEAPAILDRISKVITPKSIVYISNPGLPYGVHLDQTKLQAFMNRHPDCLFVVDEAYIEFLRENFRELSAKTLIDKNPNLVVIRTFSKIYGLAGHRVAFAMTQKNNIQKFMFAYKDSRLVSQESAKLAKSSLGNTAHLKKTREYLEKTKNEFYQYTKTKNHSLQIIDTKCVFLTFSAPVTAKNKHLLKKEVMDSIWEKTKYDYWSVKSKTRVEGYISISTLEKMKTDFDLLEQILAGSYVV